MRKISNSKDLTNQLFMDIDRNLNSIVRRNVAYVLNTLTPELATITLLVNGKRGTGQMSIILQYIPKKVAWEAHTPTSSYELTGLSEVSTVCKQIISRMYTTIGKF